MKPVQLATTLFIISTALAASDVRAQGYISGSIGFGSFGATVNGGDLGTSTAFTPTETFISTESGIYSGIPLLTSIFYSGFQFSPPAGSVTPLWSFEADGKTYSFDATSVTSSYDSVLHEWDIGGNGMAMATGYNPTPSTWNVNLSQSGASIVFDSSAVALAVPEPAGLIVLGAGLIGLAAYSQRRSIQAVRSNC